MYPVAVWLGVIPITPVPDSSSKHTAVDGQYHVRIQEHLLVVYTAIGNKQVILCNTYSV